MKKLLVMIACLVCTICVVHAQDTTAKKVSLKDELGLTKEQVVKYKEIGEKYKTAVATTEADAALDEKAKKAKRKS